MKVGRQDLARLVMAMGACTSACVTGALEGGTDTDGDGADVDVDVADDAPGHGDDADRGDDPDEDGKVVPPDPCATCVGERCGASFEACDASAECVALAECGGRCADEACYRDCEADHPDGVDDLMAYYGCIESSCADDCGGEEDPGNGGGGGGDPEGDDQLDDAEPADPCNACAEQTCTPEYDACLDSQECLAFAECAGQCQDEDCWLDCVERNEVGADTYYVLAECAYERCRAECGY